MKIKINTYIEFAIWTITFYLTISEVEMIGVLKRTNNNFSLLIFLGLINNLIIFYGISKYVIPKLFNNMNLKGSIKILIIGYLLISLIESILDYFLIDIETSEPLYLWEILFSNLIINFAFVIAGSMYGFSIGWFNNEKQKQVLQKENLKAELAFLKAQVNPHFLFNILNMAYSSATKSNDSKTADIISELASLMRYMLYDSNVSVINIEKEIEYIENYVQLQKKRLSDEVLPNIKFNCNFKTNKSISIAPMLLIPFVENSFKHGIRMGKETFIEINLDIDEKNLHFSIKNSITKNKQLNEKIGGIGLVNVQKRLELLYPHKYELNISSDNDVYDINLKIVFE